LRSPNPTCGFPILLPRTPFRCRAPPLPIAWPLSPLWPPPGVFSFEWPQPPVDAPVTDPGLLGPRFKLERLAPFSAPTFCHPPSRPHPSPPTALLPRSQLSFSVWTKFSLVLPSSVDFFLLVFSCARLRFSSIFGPNPAPFFWPGTYFTQAPDPAL